MLLNYKSDKVLQLIKLGFAMSVVVGFPLMIYPCRQSIFTLFLAGSKPTYNSLNDDTTFIPNSSKFYMLRGFHHTFNFLGENDSPKNVNAPNWLKFHRNSFLIEKLFSLSLVDTGNCGHYNDRCSFGRECWDYSRAQWCSNGHIYRLYLTWLVLLKDLVKGFNGQFN